MTTFNKFKFKNKSTIYLPVSRSPGIFSIWDWNEKTSCYEKRESGLKYYAIKRVGSHAGKRRQVSKCLESLEAAKTWKSSPGLFTEKKTHLTFQEALEKYLVHMESRLRRTTIECYSRYKGHLSFFLSMPVKDITSFMIDEWLRMKKSPSHRVTLKDSRLSFEKELEFLGRVLKFYSEYVDESYVVPLKARHKKDSILDLEKYLLSKAEARSRYLSYDEAQRFLKALADQSKEDPKKWVFYHLALFQMRTGARVGEACALHWQDLALDTGIASIQKTVQWFRSKGVEPIIGKVPKNGHFRALALTEAHVKELRWWSTLNSNDLVFCGSGGKVLSYRQIQHAYNNAFSQIGSKFRSTHILRHSFATNFLEITNDIHSLKTMLGHSKIAQTEVYAKVTEAKKNQSFELFSSKMTSVLEGGVEGSSWEMLGRKAEA